jgi:hypothetical protein
LHIKRGKANCSLFKQTWPRPSIGDRCLLIIVSCAHPNLSNKCFALPSAFYTPIRLPLSSSPSHPRLRRRYGPRLKGKVLQGGGPADTSPSVFLSAVRRPRQESEVPRWRRWAVQACHTRASSSALHGRGRLFVGPGGEAVHAHKAKLADSSNTLHGEVGFFPQRKGRSGPHALRWERNPPETTWAEEWCW